MTDIMSPSELLEVVSLSSARERIEYYRGSLSTDIARHGKTRLHAWRMLNMARSISSYGIVTLVQKRMAEDDYIYYAIRTNKKSIPLILKTIVRDIEEAIRPRRPSPWWTDGTG